MKSKRLKNFCQICRKQCKDENGFHCHLNSTIHKNKLRDLVLNPGQHLEKHSQELERKIIQILKAKYPGELKSLEDIYEQYAEDKYAIRLSHTKWKTLQQFANHLQNVKNLYLEGGPQWKIMYTVNKANEFVEANRRKLIEQTRNKQRELLQKTISRKIEKQKAAEERERRAFQTEMKKQQKQRNQLEFNQKIQLDLDGLIQEPKRNAMFTVQELERDVQLTEKEEQKCKNIASLGKKLELKQQDQEEQEIEWILPNIVVRIKPHQIDPAFHHKKCKINAVIEPYVAQLKVGTATIEIDQTYLETVIPKIGGKVIVLIGKHKGKKGIVKAAAIENGSATIEIEGIDRQYLFAQISKFDE